MMLPDINGLQVLAAAETAPGAAGDDADGAGQ
jgi:hypothetical protein